MRGRDTVAASPPIGDKDIVINAPRADGGFAIPTGEQVVRAVMRHWPVVAVAAVAAMLLGWLFAAVQPKRYRATAVGAVSPAVEKLETTDVLRGVDALERRVVVSTVAALASMPVVTDKVIPSSLHGYSVHASVVPMTNLFNVSVEGADPKQVAAIANRVPDALAGPAITMYKLYRVTLVSPATVPRAPFLPRAGRAAIAGLLLGLVAGVAFAWLLDRRRERVRT